MLAFSCSNYFALIPLHQGSGSENHNDNNAHGIRKAGHFMEANPGPNSPTRLRAEVTGRVDARGM